MWPECWDRITSIAGRILLDRPLHTAVPIRPWTVGTIMTTWDGCTLPAAVPKPVLPMAKLSTDNMTDRTRWGFITTCGGTSHRKTDGAERIRLTRLLTPTTDATALVTM